jgi:hypothetical protein
LKSIIFTISPVQDISRRSAKEKLGTTRTGNLALMAGAQQYNNLGTKYVPYMTLNTTKLFGPPTHSAA